MLKFYKLAMFGRFLFDDMSCTKLIKITQDGQHYSYAYFAILICLTGR